MLVFVSGVEAKEFSNTFKENKLKELISIAKNVFEKVCSGNFYGLQIELDCLKDLISFFDKFTMTLEEKNLLSELKLKVFCMEENLQNYLNNR